MGDCSSMCFGQINRCPAPPDRLFRKCWAWFGDAAISGCRRQWRAATLAVYAWSHFRGVVRNGGVLKDQATGCGQRVNPLLTRRRRPSGVMRRSGDRVCGLNSCCRFWPRWRCSWSSTHGGACTASQDARAHHWHGAPAKKAADDGAKPIPFRRYPDAVGDLQSPRLSRKASVGDARGAASSLVMAPEVGDIYKLPPCASIAKALVPCRAYAEHGFSVLVRRDAAPMQLAVGKHFRSGTQVR